MSPKPKGVGVMIALGRPGASAPPRYKSPGGEEPAPPKKPPFAPAAEESPAHEATEEPDVETGENYGAKLTADIDAVFEGAGIDKMQGRQIASQLFSAVAKCLGGDGEEPAAEPAMDGMDNQNSEGY